jgi:hypothetical protein
MKSYNIGDLVLFNEEQYKITQKLMGIYWGRKKYAREDSELPLDKITLLKSSKKEKTPPPIKITREERGLILKSLIESESLKVNFKREIIILARLIRKFPHKDFWLDGFKPAIKVKSLLYWENRPEVENLYKKWALDLTTKTELVLLENNKVIEDIILEKKRPKNLLDLLS